MSVSHAIEYRRVCVQKDGRLFRGSGIESTGNPWILSSVCNNEDIRDSYRGV